MCVCVCFCALTTTESYTVKNISQSNLLQFLSTECLINKQKKRLTLKSSTEGTLCAYRRLVLTESCTLTAVRQGQRFAKNPSTEQSSGRTPKEHSEIKRPAINLSKMRLRGIFNFKAELGHFLPNDCNLYQSMDNSGTEISRANYNEHLKLYPCEF